MAINTRTLIVVGASTIIGFIGDVATYSVAASKGTAFKVVVPKGKDLISVLVLGIIGGFIIDYACKKIEDLVKPDEEVLLDALVIEEKNKIEKGIIKNKNPKEVVWA